jgi:hypothetical protein
MADQVTYSGTSLPAADLDYWQTIVTKELERME